MAANTGHFFGDEGTGKDQSCYSQENLRKVDLLSILVRFLWFGLLVICFLGDT